MEYCSKGHWEGGDPQPEPPIKDWEDCGDYQIRKCWYIEKYKKCDFSCSSIHFCDIEKEFNKKLN